MDFKKSTTSNLVERLSDIEQLIMTCSLSGVAMPPETLDECRRIKEEIEQREQLYRDNCTPLQLDSAVADWFLVIRQRGLGRLATELSVDYELPQKAGEIKINPRNPFFREIVLLRVDTDPEVAGGAIFVPGGELGLEQLKAKFPDLAPPGGQAAYVEILSLSQEGTAPAQEASEPPARTALYAQVDGPKSPERHAQIKVDGHPAYLSGGQVKIGRSYPLDETGRYIDDPRVSREHATMWWSDSHQKFLIRDHSTSGTWIKKPGMTDFVHIRDAEVTVGPDDEIRLGAPDGVELRVSACDPRNPEADSLPGEAVAAAPVQLGAGTLPWQEPAVRSRTTAAGFMNVPPAESDPEGLNQIAAPDFMNSSTAGYDRAADPTVPVRLANAAPMDRNLFIAGTSSSGSGPIAGSPVGESPPAIKRYHLRLTDGRLEIGRNFLLDDSGARIEDPMVSREHGTLRWNESDRSFYYSDHSSYGTWIKRSKAEAFEVIKQEEVKVGSLDEIRLASPDGPQLRLPAMAPAADAGNQLLEVVRTADGRTARIEFVLEPSQNIVTRIIVSCW